MTIHKTCDRTTIQAPPTDGTPPLARRGRNLEQGRPVRPTSQVLERLADVLGLDRSQRATLYLYTSGTLPLVTEVDEPAAQALRVLLDTLMPHPAIITGSTWNILGYNLAAADWFPWLQDGVNFMRWFFLDPEAREQLSDWHRHASNMIGMLRISHAQHHDDPQFVELLQEILADRERLALWQQGQRVHENDNTHLRLHRAGGEEVTALVHVLVSGEQPDRPRRHPQPIARGRRPARSGHLRRPCHGRHGRGSRAPRRPRRRPPSRTEQDDGR
ncbi:helix-turn-helix transcriptional regulator [Streptomyces sp. YIM 98790]|uniref:helix-turn-helix transcriptional regulator n=1 Tax=Streptomyces sp. YIM 98790 TaxID=2689077 RepID=UPI00140BDBB6|nr:helix-turn-helix transcriptional regulator [Streptomyces sp. YIM 98790]